MPMTEAEWLACADPNPMLEFLRGKASDRKLRLFACACCRRLRGLFPGQVTGRGAIPVAERFADGLVTKAELKAARQKTSGCEVAATRSDAFAAAVETAGAIADAARWLAIDSLAWEAIVAGYATHTPAADRLASEQTLVQCGLLRDIFGNAVRPSPRPSPAVLAWNDRTVPRLAQAIYSERRWADMPILADALLDAGCEDEALIQHCRSAGPHVRGCWAVDLILGKG
jgi:hypothetical protein